MIQVVACINPGRQIEGQTFTILFGDVIVLRRHAENISKCLELLYNLRSNFETVSNTIWKYLESGAP